MIKPITTSTLLLALLFLNSSCESDAFFEVVDGNTKLHAFCEMTSDEKIKVFVSTAVGLNTDDEFFYPKQSDTEVVLMQDGEELENPGFRYISREKAFVSQGSFRPEIGVGYGLKVKMKDDSYDILPIYAETSIPALEFDMNTIIRAKSEGLLTATIEIDRSKSKYLCITMYDSKMNSEAIGIDRLTDEEKLVKKISGNRSLLVKSEEGGNKISLDLDVSNHVIGDSIFFQVKSITEDAYEYYKAYDGQLQEGVTFLYEPVIDRSNFRNGLGLFAGYSSSSLAFPIQ